MKHFSKVALIGILSTQLCFSTEHYGQAPNLSADEGALTGPLPEAYKTFEQNKDLIEELDRFITDVQSVLYKLPAELAKIREKMKVWCL